MLPFLIGGALSALYSGNKALDASVDSATAKAMTSRVNEILSEWRPKAQQAQEAASEAIMRLGEKKLETLDELLSPFVSDVEKVVNVEFNEIKGLNEEGIARLKEMAKKRIALRSASGEESMLAIASYAVIGIFGGAVLAPLAMYFRASKAREQKDNARMNLLKAREFREEARTLITLCNGIMERSRMFEDALRTLNQAFAPLVRSVHNIIAERGTDYREYTDSEKKTLATAFSTAGAIKSVLDTPILTEDGQLTSESAALPEKIQSMLD